MTLRVDGTLDVSNVEGKPEGTPDQIKTHVFKKIRMVKGGDLVMDSLPLLFKDDPVKFSLKPLATLPQNVVSATADVTPIAAELADIAMKSLYFKAARKVANDFRSNFEPVVASSEPSEWEKSIGLKRDGSFSPKAAHSHSASSETPFSVKVKLKSLSSLPKIDAVVKKMDAGKKLTLSDEFLHDHLEKYMGKTLTADYLDGQIKAIEAELRNLSRASYFLRLGIKESVKDGDTLTVENIAVEVAGHSTSATVIVTL